MALYQIATLESWSEIMFNMIKSVDADHVPVLKNNMYIVLYIIAFIVFTGFIIVNIVNSIIISSFNR
jgi:hypothetical protein